MAKKKSPEPEIIKLQIPVSAELAEQLAQHAMKLEYTQARLCKILLRFAVEDFRRVAQWLEIRTVGKLPKGVKPGWLQLSDNSAVRLQVPVPVEVAERVEELANRLNHTAVRMAALLLDFMLADERFMLAVMESTTGKLITRMLGRPTEEYESAEIEGDFQ